MSSRRQEAEKAGSQWALSQRSRRRRGELDRGGPVLVNAGRHRAVLGNHFFVRAVDLPVVKRVLDRYRRGAAELGEPHAAARLLLLVAQIAFRDASAHRVARSMAGAEQPVADAQVLDRQGGEEGGYRLMTGVPQVGTRAPEPAGYPEIPVARLRVPQLTWA